MARKWLPDNVTEWRDRHGKRRYRFRKAGLPVHHFKHAPGTPEFLAELYEAQNAKAERESRWPPFTYDALAVAYYATARWNKCKPSTQETYRRIIDGFREDNGGQDIRKVSTASIDRKLAKMKDTPAAANNLRKSLALLHRHAIKLGWRTDNPVASTDAYPTGEGFHCWTDDELAAFDARWPFGTRERLAKELLLGTALRKSDVLSVGKGHRKGDRLNLHHSKNNSDTSIRIGPSLQAALDAYPESDPYLITQFGKPFTPTGFYNWFKRACVKAGIGHCSPHGLRKAMSRRLAESGATVLEGRAVTGHKTDREFMKYAESANRQVLSDRALANLDGDAWRTSQSGRKNVSDSND